MDGVQAMETYTLYGDRGTATRITIRLLTENHVRFTFTLTEYAPIVPLLSTPFGDIGGTERIRHFIDETSTTASRPLGILRD